MGAGGSLVRHYCMTGKEPFETPDTVVAISEAWHAAAVRNRCGTIGAITASPSGLASAVAELSDRAPLSWVLGSLDVAATGLRAVANNKALIGALLNARQAGAIGAFGINTLLTDENINDVMVLGRTLAKLSVNQWSIGPLMNPQRGRMVSGTNQETFLKFIELLVASSEFMDGPMEVTLSLEYPDLLRMVGESSRIEGNVSSWRYQYRISKYFALIALNPTPNRFLRARWDGELLSLEDFLTLGIKQGSYGTYSPGRAGEILSALAQEARGIAKEGHRTPCAGT